MVQVCRHIKPSGERCNPGRRPRDPRGHGALAPPPEGHGRAAELPVQRQRAREHPARAARGRARARSATPRPGSAASTPWRRSRTGWRPRWRARRGHLGGPAPACVFPARVRRGPDAYLTWEPRAGRTDAERNCISNIRAEGLSYAAAAHKLTFLMNESRRLKLSGVRLKEEAASWGLDSQRPTHGPSKLSAGRRSTVSDR